MKTKSNIFKWVLFTLLTGYCVITLTYTLTSKKHNLTMGNIEALAEWEWDDIFKYCELGKGWCYINNIEYFGVIYAED